eukprot:SAG31_NODE_19456_length_601_cov_0.968127_2_plen_112_part_01
MDAFSYRRDLFTIIQQGDLRSEISLIYLDPPRTGTGSGSGGLSAATLQNLEDDIRGLQSSFEHVYHAENISVLADVFLQAAEDIDLEYNERGCSSPQASQRYSGWAGRWLN